MESLLVLRGSLGRFAHLKDVANPAADLSRHVSYCYRHDGGDGRNAPRSRFGELLHGVFVRLSGGDHLRDLSQLGNNTRLRVRLLRSATRRKRQPADLGGNLTELT